MVVPGRLTFSAVASPSAVVVNGDEIMIPPHPFLYKVEQRFQKSKLNQPYNLPFAPITQETEFRTTQVFLFTLISEGPFRERHVVFPGYLKPLLAFQHASGFGLCLCAFQKGTSGLCVSRWNAAPGFAFHRGSYASCAFQRRTSVFCASRWNAEPGASGTEGAGGQNSSGESPSLAGSGR